MCTCISYDNHDDNNTRKGISSFIIIIIIMIITHYIIFSPTVFHNFSCMLNLFNPLRWRSNPFYTQHNDAKWPKNNSSWHENNITSFFFVYRHTTLHVITCKKTDKTCVRNIKGVAVSFNFSSSSSNQLDKMNCCYTFRLEIKCSY